MNASTQKAIKGNWDIVCAELDKIGITVEDSFIDLLVKGNLAELNKLYARVERYLQIIAGDEFLKF